MNSSKQNLNHLTLWLALRTLFCPSKFSNMISKLKFGLTFNLSTNGLHNCFGKYLENSLEICSSQWEQHSPFSVTYKKERKRQENASSGLCAFCHEVCLLSLNSSSEQSFYVATGIILSLLFQEAVHHNRLLSHSFEIAKLTTSTHSLLTWLTFWLCFLQSLKSENTAKFFKVVFLSAPSAPALYLFVS